MEKKSKDVEKVERDLKVKWDDKGKPRLVEKKKIKKGKKARASGARFELRVRKDLEEKGFIVDKWTNNLDLEKEKIEPAKRKFNPFSRVMTIGTGFPDFIAIQLVRKGVYDVIGVEVKKNGILKKEEKQKCKWYLDNNIFSSIWIGKGVKKGTRLFVEYDDFYEKYYDKVKL